MQENALKVEDNGKDEGGTIARVIFTAETGTH